jgi:hypothetical protein
MIYVATATALITLSISSAAEAEQKPYQVTAQTACTTFGCPLNFPPLTAPAIVKHVSCQFVGIVNNTGLVVYATLSVNDKSGTGSEYLPVNDLGNVYPFTGEVYLLNSSPYLFGDVGSNFSVTVTTILTAQPMVCTISGDYIDTKTTF